jgi:tetratricopeptide (TPR) repeat protein
MLNRILACGSLLGLITLVGCSAGHGKTTAEQLKVSQNRLAALHAGNEYDLAHQAYDAGEMDKADKFINKCLQTNPNVPKSYILKGRIQLEKGDLEQALIAFQKAETIDPKNIDSHYYQGIVYERFTQTEKAMDQYKTAADMDPTNPQYAIATAETLIDLGRLDEAEQFLTSRAASFDHAAGIKQTLGHIAMLRGDHEGAVTLFSDARLLASDDTAILEDLVHAEISTGRYSDAEFNLTKLQKVPANKDRRDLRQMRARCLMNLDRPIEARDVLIELTQGDDGQHDVEAWIELGNVCFMIKDMNRTRQSWQRVVAIAPERCEGWMLKALYQRRTNDPAGALKTVAKAVERRGDNVDPLMLQGMIYQDLGKTTEATASFKLALQQDPNNVEALKALNGVVASGENKD